MLRNNSKKVRRTEINNFLEVLSTYLKHSHSNQHRVDILKGVTCKTYRANIYAMMIGSLTDDQTGHNKTILQRRPLRQYWTISSKITSCPSPGTDIPGSNAHIPRTICIPISRKRPWHVSAPWRLYATIKS